MPIFLSVYYEDGITENKRALISKILAKPQNNVRPQYPNTLCFTLDPADPVGRVLNLCSESASVCHEAAMGLHLGKANRLGGVYTGPCIEHTRCLAESGWPGQVLASQAFVEAAYVPPDVELKGLGRHKLKDLTPPEHIYQLVNPLLPQRNSRLLRTLTHVPNNLRPQNRGFIGRSEERQDLEALLVSSDHRLVMLKGPGGIGKTRLALQVAAETAMHFLDGVYIVFLESLDSLESLPSKLIDVLDLSIRRTRQPQAQLFAHLHDKTMLLILDTFEHLLPAPPLIMEMLDATPDLKLLVTSRVALEIPEEIIYPVCGLTFPSRKNDHAIDTYDAVQLFVQAAQRVKPLFTLSEENREPVRRICQQLTGTPLGIELAASWIRLFSPAKIAMLLEENVESLVTSRRDILKRHRSLRAVFDQSWRLLTATERNVFPQLTVFHDGFRTEAAVRITGATATILSSLHTKSFLWQTSEGRFRILQPIRQFAAQELALRTNVWLYLKDRHAAYYINLAAKHTPHLWTDRQQAIMRELTPEMQNLRAAWRWTVEQSQVAAVNKAIEFMYRFHRVRGHFQEGESLFQSARENLERTVSDNTTPEVRGTLAKLQECAAMFTFYLSKLEAAQQEMEESLVVFQELNLQRYEGFALIGLGMIAYEYGQLSEAEAYFRQSYHILNRLEDRYASSRAIRQLGNVHYTSGRYKQALSHYRESLALHKTLGARLGIADCLYSIGQIEAVMAHFSTAQENFTESLEIYRDFGDKQGTSAVQIELGMIDTLEGRFRDGKAHFEEALALRQQLGDPALIVEATLCLTGSAYSLGDFEQVQRYIHTLLELRSEYQQPVILGLTAIILGVFKIAQGRLEESRAHLENAVDIMTKIGYQRQRMRAQGYLILALILQGKLERAERLCYKSLDYINSIGARQFRGYRLTGLGMINVAKQSYAEAKHYFHQAIVEGVEIGMKPAAIDALQNLASQIVAQTDPETALAWLTLIIHHPASDTLQKQSARQAIKQLVEYLPAERVEAARDRGLNLTLSEVVAEILLDRR